MANLNPTPPFSVVLSGGGMHCSWSAGFLVGLHDIELLPITIIAKSGNAGNAVYLATGQSNMIKRIWVEHLSGNRFINFFRFRKIIDIDFLVDEVLTKREPMNFVALKNSSIKVVVACFNITKQKMVYFSNENINFNVLKASKAMPIVYGKKVYINNDAYADKPYSPYKIIVDQKKNLERKILLVDVSENGFLIRNLFKMLDSKNKEGSLQEMFIIKPDNLKTSILSRSKKVLEKSFDEGYQYAISREATIREYLNN